MIKIQVFEHEGKLTGFRVRGHSNFDEAGKDIVCAGISVLTQSALLGIGKHLSRAVDYGVEKGSLFMELKEAPDDLTEAILRTMLLGILEIEGNYPEAVKLKKIVR